MFIERDVEWEVSKTSRLLNVALVFVGMVYDRLLGNYQLSKQRLQDLLFGIHRDSRGRRTFRGGYILSVKRWAGRTLIVTHRRTWWVSIQKSEAPFTMELPCLLNPHEIAELRVLLRAHHWAERHGLIEQDVISIEGGNYTVSDGGVLHSPVKASGTVLYQHMHRKDDLGREAWFASMEQKRTRRDYEQGNDSCSADELLGAGGESHPSWNNWLWTKRHGRRVWMPMFRYYVAKPEDFACSVSRKEPNPMGPIPAPGRKSYLEGHSFRIADITALGGWRKVGDDWQQVPETAIEPGDPSGFIHGLMRRLIQDDLCRLAWVEIQGKPGKTEHFAACTWCGEEEHPWARRKHAFVCEYCAHEEWRLRVVLTIPKEAFLHKEYGRLTQGFVFPDYKIPMGADALRVTVYGPWCSRVLGFKRSFRASENPIVRVRTLSRRVVDKIAQEIEFLLAR